MKTDVERIRAMHPSERSASDVVDLLFDDLRQAKRTIAALRWENEELRRMIGLLVSGIQDEEYTEGETTDGVVLLRVPYRDVLRARAMLHATPEPDDE